MISSISSHPIIMILLYLDYSCKFLPVFFGIFWNFKKFDVVYLISEEAKKVTIRQTGLTHVPPDTLMVTKV